jgi:hypothetical protein
VIGKVVFCNLAMSQEQIVERKLGTVEGAAGRLTYAAAF